MASTVQVRLSGGPLHGQVLWIAAGCSSVNVNLRDQETGVKRVLVYEKRSVMFVFTGESEAPEATPAPGRAPEDAPTSRIVAPGS